MCEFQTKIPIQNIGVNKKFHKDNANNWDRSDPQVRECVDLIRSKIEAAQIMYAITSRKAANQFRRWRDKWQDKIPRAVKCLERDFDKLIPFLEFAASFHKVIRTTNVIERCFREVRRRLKVMGSFQDSKSCKRIVVSLFEYLNKKWSKRIHRIKDITEYYLEVA